LHESQRVSDTRYNGWHSPAFAAYRVSTVPTIVLVGPDGRVESGRYAVGGLVAGAK